MAGVAKLPARGWLIAFLLCTCAGISLLRGGVAGRSRMPSAGQSAAVLASPPPGCGRHPPGCGPVRCLCVSNLHAERFLVAFAAEAALATWNPGQRPSRRGGGWPTPDRVVQRGVVGCSPEGLCVSRLGGWGVVDGLRTAPQTQGFPAHPLCPSVSSKQGKIFL